jgi:hypothetical protein
MIMEIICFVKRFSSHFSIKKVWVGVHVPAKPDVQGIGKGLTTIPDAGKVPPDISTTRAPDMALV